MIVYGLLCVSVDLWAATPPMSRATLSLVQRAYNLQQDDKQKEAIQVLKKAKPQRGYDKAYINTMLGKLYWQTQESESAVRHLIMAVDSGALPEKEHKETQRMLADILLMQQDYARAENRYRKLITLYNTAEDLALLWLRMAQTQYQRQQWQQVEHSIAKQQSYQRKASLKPKIMPLKMLLEAQLAQSKWSVAIDTVKLLRELEPDNYLWWHQLVTLHRYTHNHRQSLVVLQQAQRAGLTLREPDIKLMAQLYAQQQLPEKAARVYQQLSQLNHSTALLAQQAMYWQQAKEWHKAAQSWTKAASLDSDYFWQLALLYLKIKQYQEAIDAINKLPVQSQEAQLAKLHALYALGENDQALDMARQLHRQNPSDTSLSWIQFLSQ